jgi:FkbM family methyltransferase
MKRLLIRLYKQMFVRKFFYPISRIGLKIALWGVGISNYENDGISGEDHFLHQLPRYLEAHKQPVVFDVGANIGRYSNKVIKSVPLAILHAFEPDPQAYLALNRDARRLGYQAWNMGLGAASGNATLYRQEDGDSEFSTLLPEVISEVHHSTAAPVPITLSTLDQFAAQHHIDHIHLLKIDTEGSEFDILQGASNLLSIQAIDLIQFEFNSMNVVRRVFFRDFHGLLRGFTFYRLMPDGLVSLQPDPPFLSEIFAFQNILAIRNPG